MYDVSYSLSVGKVASCGVCCAVLRVLFDTANSFFLLFFFFFNDTATTEIYTLSLHDALPIWKFATGSGGFESDLNFEPSEKFPWGPPFAEF